MKILEFPKIFRDIFKISMMHRNCFRVQISLLVRFLRHVNAVLIGAQASLQKLNSKIQVENYLD